LKYESILRIAVRLAENEADQEVEPRDLIFKKRFNYYKEQLLEEFKGEIE